MLVKTRLEGSQGRRLWTGFSDTSEFQSSGAVWTGRQAWDLIPYPILPPSLISHTVYVAVKNHERKKNMSVWQLMMATLPLNTTPVYRGLSFFQ